MSLPIALNSSPELHAIRSELKTTTGFIDEQIYHHDNHNTSTKQEIEQDLGPHDYADIGLDFDMDDLELEDILTGMTNPDAFDKR